MGGLFLYGLLPLLIFAVIDAFSHRVSFAVGAAVLCAFGELLLLYQVTGQVDPVSLAAVFLFIVFGLFSVRRDNRRLFKLQPAVLAGLTGGLVGYLEFFGQPVVYRYLPLLKAAAPGELAQALQDPAFLALIDRMFDYLVMVLFLDALLIAYAALYCRTAVWLMVNVFGLYLMAFLVAIGVMGFAFFVG